MTLYEIERTDVIQPCRVITMRMGEEHRIQMTHPGTQHLLTEIRPGVHHQHLPLMFNQNGGSKPLVPLIGG